MPRGLGKRSAWPDRYCDIFMTTMLNKEGWRWWLSKKLKKLFDCERLEELSTRKENIYMRPVIGSKCCETEHSMNFSERATCVNWTQFKVRNKIWLIYCRPSLNILVSKYCRFPSRKKHVKTFHTCCFCFPIMSEQPFFSVAESVSSLCLSSFIYTQKIWFNEKSQPCKSTLLCFWYVSDKFLRQCMNNNPIFLSKLAKAMEILCLKMSQSWGLVFNGTETTYLESSSSGVTFVVVTESSLVIIKQWRVVLGNGEVIPYNACN